MLSDTPHGLDWRLNIVDGTVVVVGILLLVRLKGFVRLREPPVHHSAPVHHSDEGGDVYDAVVEEMVHLGHLEHDHLAIALYGIPDDGAGLFHTVILILKVS